MSAFVVDYENDVFFQTNGGIVPVEDKDSAVFDVTGTVVAVGNVRNAEITVRNARNFYHELVGSVSVATLNVF